MKVCPSCNFKNPDTEDFCKACGFELTELLQPPKPPAQEPVSGEEVGVVKKEEEKPSLAPSMGRCKDCGAVLQPGARFCQACGAKVSVSIETQKPSEEAKPPVTGPRIIWQTKKGDQVFVLQEKDNVIGREQGKTTITIPDDSRLSRVHAKVAYTNGKYVIEDMHSTNGTFLKITGQYELKDGDTIQMGDTVMTYKAS